MSCSSLCGVGPGLLQLAPSGHPSGPRNLTGGTCKTRAEAAVARDLLQLWTAHFYGDPLRRQQGGQLWHREGTQGTSTVISQTAGLPLPAAALLNFQFESVYKASKGLLERLTSCSVASEAQASTAPHQLAEPS